MQTIRLLCLSATLLLPASTLQAQDRAAPGDAEPTTKHSTDPNNKITGSSNEPAVGGRILAECSAEETSVRLGEALQGLRGVKKLTSMPARSLQLEYRGQPVILDISAHGSCQSSFQARLPYRGRPGEAAAIRRAYSAIMEPAVATLATCDPKACQEAEAERADKRKEAEMLAERQSSPAPEPAATVASDSAAVLAYLEQLPANEAYTEATRRVRDALPTPRSAEFPRVTAQEVKVQLLDEAPTGVSGQSELEALRKLAMGGALTPELKLQLERLLIKVEQELAGPCYRVSGYVDFQNRCGVLVRGRYQAYLSRREGAPWFALGQPELDYPDCPGR
ncbi:MAG: hypothetical protein CMP23_00525 [Rickettsiales bacterium]|nr:hypothetical protein [Rickettsiales bacterium]|tara:strand:- start:694 stop:1701 length:1008 start_codon:yes stop_codon:yes gene_type:complete